MGDPYTDFWFFPEYVLNVTKLTVPKKGVDKKEMVPYKRIRKLGSMNDL